jgi:hypothetical protein
MSGIADDDGYEAPGSELVTRLKVPGNLCQAVDPEASRSPGWRPQARKCL